MTFPVVGISPNYKFTAESTLSKNLPEAQFKEGFDFAKHLRINRENGQPVAEFINTGDFANTFFQRQEYEVEAGRKEVPLLYGDIYDVQTNANFPKTLEINTLGPAGVTIEEVQEGGEVKFATVGSTDKTITMKHKAIGLQYTEDMFIYNQTWMFPGLERDFGNAWNAEFNHTHLSPIITASYTGGQVTDGTAMTSFRKTDSTETKYLRALEQAMADSMNDVSNPRYGPYIILASVIDAWFFHRALTVVPQQGAGNVQLAADAMGLIQGVVAYNGWQGERGKKAVSYSGVTAGTAYLIHVGHKRYDFLSRWKQGLRRQTGGADITRFVLDKVVWDARYNIYANPGRAVQKITLPTAASGAS